MSDPNPKFVPDLHHFTVGNWLVLNFDVHWATAGLLELDDHARYEVDDLIDAHLFASKRYHKRNFYAKNALAEFFVHLP